MKVLKGWILLPVVLLCFFLLTSCGEKEEKTLSSQTVASQESQKESTGAIGESSEETGEEVRYMQEGSAAPEGYEPVITFRKDGTFSFSAFCYDGTVTWQGTFTQEGDVCRLHPDTTTAPEGAVGSELSEITLTKGEDGSLIYSGEPLGVTGEGAQFQKE